MQVDFYHLVATPAERALTGIAEKIVAGGGRLLIVADDDALAERIDQWLWRYSPESFLPHGRVGRGGEGEQPVLIAAAPEAANAARFVALADGVWREAALDYDRAFHFFDDATIGDARAAWKGLASRDAITRNYWKQDDAGRWQKTA